MEEENMMNLPASIAEYKSKALEHCESYYCNFNATVCTTTEEYCWDSICDEDLFTCHYDNVTCVTDCFDSNASLCNNTWNCTINYECDTHQILSKVMESVVIFMYSLIFIFGFLGNGTVCYIVSASQRMRTVTNFFIVNLAVGDILMTLLCIPFSFVSVLIYHYWPFGQVMCTVVSYMQAITVLVSAYTLVAITIERYVALIYPLRPRMTKLQSKCIIVSVWLVAIAIACPIAVVTGLLAPDVYYELCDQYVCMELWGNPDDRGRYSLALMIFQYFIPLSVLVGCYSRIAMVVWGNRMPGEDGNNSGQRMARSKKKVIKMLVTVVAVFTLCWLPFNVLQVVGDVQDSIWAWKHIKYVWFCSHWLSMSHTCYNPIIYCWMNKDFRFGFFCMLLKIPGLRRLVPRSYHQSRAFINFQRSSASMKCRRENSFKSCEKMRLSLRNPSIKSNTSYTNLSNTSSKRSRGHSEKSVTFANCEGVVNLQKIAKRERKISVPPQLSVFSEEDSHCGETKV